MASKAPARIVGYFDTSIEHCQTFHVLQNEEMFIGRQEHCEIIINDPTVSNKHLRIHNVIFNADNDDIPPLVYARDISKNGTLRNGLQMPHDDPVLLCDGDTLSVCLQVTLTFHETKRKPLEEDSIQEEEKKLFRNEYNISHQKLGQGGHGDVYMAVHCRTNRQLACKVVDLRRIGAHRHTSHDVSKSDAAASRSVLDIEAQLERKKREEFKIRSKLKVLKQFKQKTDREFEVLRKCTHPNIIRLERVFKTENTLYIFQELICGGDLFSLTSSNGGALNEVEAAVITRQVLKAVEYLHSHDIVHRDLKPDNILVDSLDIGARVVLTDFGAAIDLAKEAKNNAKMKRMKTKMIGTVEYAAPETMISSTESSSQKSSSQNKGYTKAVDMWSIGCVTAFLLLGRSPFACADDPRYPNVPDEEITKCVLKGDLQSMKADELWANLSSRVRDFINRLLVLNDKSRMTATDALNHSWFANKTYRDEFEAVYQRAIKDWESPSRSEDLVQELHLPNQVSKPHVVSPYFHRPDLQVPRPEPSPLNIMSKVDVGVGSIRSIGGNFSEVPYQRFADPRTPDLEEMSMDPETITEILGRRPDIVPTVEELPAGHVTDKARSPGSSPSASVTRSQVMLQIDRISESPSDSVPSTPTNKQSVTNNVPRLHFPTRQAETRPSPAVQQHYPLAQLAPNVSPKPLTSKLKSPSYVVRRPSKKRSVNQLYDLEFEDGPCREEHARHGYAPDQFPRGYYASAWR